MDHGRFDALIRHLAASASRRTVLTRLILGAPAAAAPTIGGDASSRRCPPCRKKRRGRCRKKRPDGAPCGNGGRCRGGGCDHNVCALDCAGAAASQPCGPAGSACQCVNAGEGVGACVRVGSGASCDLAAPACETGQLCGIPCTTYLPSCWAPCV